MPKYLTILFFSFLSLAIFAQDQNKSSDLKQKMNKTRSDDSIIRKQLVSPEFKWTNLFIVQNFSFVYPEIKMNKIKYEGGIDPVDFNDKSIELSIWKSINRYLWAGIDYSNSSYKLYLVNSFKYYTDNNNYQVNNAVINDVSSLNTLSGKVGIGYSFSMKDFNILKPKCMVNVLGFFGFRSSLVSSSIEDRGSFNEGMSWGDYYYESKPISGTKSDQTNSFTFGFMGQASLLGFSFMGGIESYKTHLPSVSEAYIYNLDLKETKIKLGIGFAF